METVVALHGLLDSPRSFDGLRDDLPLVTPRIPQNRQTLQSRSEWLQGWIEKEGLEDYYLLGHSLGGALAAISAPILQPRALLLIAPAGFGPLPLARLVAGPLHSPLHLSAPWLLRVSPLVRTVYKHLFTSGHSLPDYLQAELQRDPRGVVRRAEKEMRIVSLLDKEPLHDIAFRGPVHALWGERDHLVPWQEGRGVRAVFPSARITRLPGVGHDPVREDPRAVLEWIATVRGGRSEQKPRALQA